MNDIIELIKYNFKETIELSYDVNNFINNITKSINRMINDGILDDENKYLFIKNIFKEYLYGNENKTGRFKQMLLRFDEISNRYRDLEKNDTNIEKLKEDLIIMLDTSSKIMLSQDREYIKKKIREGFLNNNSFSEREKGLALNILVKNTELDILYDDLVMNKINDCKNAVKYSKEKVKEDNPIIDNKNTPSFNEMLKDGNTSFVSKIDLDVK